MFWGLGLYPAASLGRAIRKFDEFIKEKIDDLLPALKCGVLNPRRFLII